MTDQVINPIWIGYEFEQSFTLDDGIVPDGAGLRGVVHYRKLANIAVTSKTDSITFENPEDNTFTLRIAAGVTAMMQPGEAYVEPVVTTMVERPLGVRITIPVERPSTPPV